MAKFGTRSLNSLKGQHPNLILVMTEAIKDTPIDFTITDGGRTVDMQQNLWFKGRDKNGKIIDKSKVVTMADGIKSKSNHQAKEDGLFYAVDLYPNIDGSIRFNDTKSLDTIAAHILNKAKELGIEMKWGGNFKSIVDKPHFELS